MLAVSCKSLVGNFLLASLIVAVASVRVGAALPIELEVAVAGDAPFGTMQQWQPLLAGMNLARLRLRGSNPGDKPTLEVVGEGPTATYLLLGVIDRRNQLQLPGGRFGQGDRAALKTFLAELPEREMEKHIERGPFGLTRQQFQQIFDDLSPPHAASTVGQSPQQLAPALLAGLKTPHAFSPTAQEALARSAPLKAELRGLSQGTVLAAALRSADLQFTPAQRQGQPFSLQIEPITPNKKSWPVGWKPAGVGRAVAPAMYRTTTIEIEGYSLAKALTAMKPHMGVPLILDERTLRLRKIDPAQVKVKLPPSKTFIRHAVDGALSQARLAGELRQDEAGRPFYWITQWGPESPRAE